MFTMQKLAMFQEVPAEAVCAPESPAEKVLRLALELPASRPQLECEAARLERMLDNLSTPVSQTGSQLMAQLAQLLEGQLDGIYGILDGDEESLQHSLELLVECDRQLFELEQQLDGLREELPLVA